MKWNISYIFGIGKLPILMSRGWYPSVRSSLACWRFTRPVTRHMPSSTRHSMFPKHFWHKAAASSASVPRTRQTPSTQGTTSSRPTYNRMEWREGGRERHSIFHCQCRALWFRPTKPNPTYRAVQMNVIVRNPTGKHSRMVPKIYIKPRNADFAAKTCQEDLVVAALFPFG